MPTEASQEITRARFVASAEPTFTADVILVDCENIPYCAAPLLLPMVEADTTILGFGSPWQGGVRKWIESMDNIQLVPTKTGKNQADMALAIEAIQLYHMGKRRFVICSDDSDLDGVCRKLRSMGASVRYVSTERRKRDKGGAISAAVEILKMVPTHEMRLSEFWGILKRKMVASRKHEITADQIADLCGIRYIQRDSELWVVPDAAVMEKSVENLENTTKLDNVVVSFEQIESTPKKSTKSLNDQNTQLRMILAGILGFNKEKSLIEVKKEINPWRALFHLNHNADIEALLTEYLQVEFSLVNNQKYVKMIRKPRLTVKTTEVLNHQNIVQIQRVLNIQNYFKNALSNKWTSTADIGKDFYTKRADLGIGKKGIYQLVKLYCPFVLVKKENNEYFLKV